MKVASPRHLLAFSSSCRRTFFVIFSEGVAGIPEKRTGTTVGRKALRPDVAHAVSARGTYFSERFHTQRRPDACSDPEQSRGEHQSASPRAGYWMVLRDEKLLCVYGSIEC